MLSVEETIKLIEVSSNVTSLTIFTIIICWAIYKWVRMNEEVKKAIVKEKETWVTKI